MKMEILFSGTLGWNGSETYVMRDKGGAAEYRFSPEPDLPPLPLTEALAQLDRVHIEETTPRAARRRRRRGRGRS